MKKLMVMAVVMCAAAQASFGESIGLNWRTLYGYIYEFGSDVNLYSGDATLYFAIGEQGSENYDSETFNGSITYGYIDENPYTQRIQAGDYDGENWSAYFTTTDASGNLFTSETLNGKFCSEPTVGFLPIDLIFNGGEWTTPAPEPTSGLLMLLGIAGLALKRKIVES